MSGQWEVVGKKKEKIKVSNQIQKLPPKAAKNVNVKIEEILPKSQVQNLYSRDANKENKSEKKPKEEKEVKKPKKAVVEPPKPKTIESALSQLNLQEFKILYQKTRGQFPNSPTVLLKELSQFLNSRIAVEPQDPTFGAKPPQYPLAIVPKEIKTVIEETIEVPEISSFYSLSLVSMAADMNKSSFVLGHKIFLQAMALKEPSVVLESLPKVNEVLKSYLNRPQIGLSLLWAVGQVRFGDPQAGFKVFEEVMLPLIEMKNYSRFVIKFLVDLGGLAEKVTKEQYALVLEAAYSNKKIPGDLQQELKEVSRKIGGLVEKSGEVLEFSLKKIGLNGDKAYQGALAAVALEGLKNQAGLKQWAGLYRGNVASSAVLLKHIDDNWKASSPRLDQKTFKSVLAQFTEANKELLSKKKKEPGLTDSANLVERLTERMTSDKRRSGGLLRLLFFAFSAATLALVYYDVRQAGSWKGSRTAGALRDAGVCDFTQKALVKAKGGLLWVDGRIEEQFPGYQKKVGNAAEPYVELGRNAGKVLCNAWNNLREAFQEKYPVFIQSIEAYAPGLVEQSQATFNHVWSSSIVYYNRSVDYLKKEVFVGQLSPENMQRVVTEALNTTQNKAMEYYHWLYEKVQTTIK